MGIYRFVGILTGFKLMAMALGTYNYFQLRLMEVEDEREDRRSQQGLENEDLPSNSFANRNVLTLLNSSRFVFNKFNSLFQSLMNQRKVKIVVLLERMSHHKW